jgi:hypothetical protein
MLSALDGLAAAELRLNTSIVSEPEQLLGVSANPS